MLVKNSLKIKAKAPLGIGSKSYLYLSRLKLPNGSPISTQLFLRQPYGARSFSENSNPLLLGRNHRPPTIKTHKIARVAGNQVRNFSFTTVPRFILHAMRIPIAGATAGAAGLTYVNYKLGDVANRTQNLLNSLTDNVKSAFGFLGDGINFDFPKLDLDIQLPEFLANFFPARPGTSASTGQLQMEMDRPRFIKKDDENSKERSHDSSAAGVVVGAAGTAALFNRDEGDDESEASTTSEGASSIPAQDDQFMLLTRKLIEVRNILMSIDHNESLKLPSIVVIGSQSSGKSSVLEAIVGHEFLPKGSNMVTRRPIELTLIHTPKSKEEYGEFPQLGLGKIHDFKHVQQTLRDLNLAVPESECISNKPIELRIYSPNVPDLTLIDLPGYIQVNNKNQPETLKDKIGELCKQYIREPNIVLAVCAADVDLANSEALKASRKVDPLGLRTIGVITKMDLVEPEVGASILRNNDYPLHLGYIGVVCNKHPASTDTRKNISSSLIRNEEQFFRNNYVYSQRGIEVGTPTLRRKLMEVLEESMAKSLFSIVGAVQSELEEARYQFKVQYNDRRITAESYVAETIDSIKHNFKDFAHLFGKPQVRHEVRTMLEQRVMDLCAELYWTDNKITELPKITPDDIYWQYKLDMCSAALTKSGIGRTSTQLVVDVLMANMERLSEMDPLSNHPETSRQVLNFSNEILRNKFHTTADQVENCVKPYKYEVECTEQEWAEGLKRSINLVEKELEYCDRALKNIKNSVGKRKLKAAIKYILDAEKEEAKRLARVLKDSDGAEDGEANVVHATSSPPVVPTANNVLENAELVETHRLHFSPKLLEKAREAIFLRDRAIVLKYRMAALKSRQCKSPENKQYCPEAFLNMVAEKLTYTAVMFIQVELLNEFFFQFPREVDNRLVYDLDRKQILAFAKENPHIRKHLELQERKRKLEEVMEKLNYLVRRQREYEGKTSQISSKKAAGS